MKILQVIQAFYPCQVWGGPPQNTLVLSRGFQARGHEVTVLTTNILDYDRKMSQVSFQGQWQGVPVIYLNAHWLLRRSGSHGMIPALDIWRFRHVILNSDIVHIHGYRHFLFLATTLLARHYQTPYLVHPRGSLPTMFGRVAVKKIFDTVLGPHTIGKASGGIALNDVEMQRMIAFGIPRTNVRKILNPFDPRLCSRSPDGQAFRERLGIASSAKLLLFLARLHEKKGVDLLIRALSMLDADDVYLAIVGPDDGFEVIARTMIHELNLEHRAFMVGPLYDQDKFDAYAAADVYVLPTRGVEGLPTTVLEACHVGTPNIITRTTEVAELVDKRVGIAVDFDVDQLARAIRQLLDSPHLLQQYRAQTRQVMREYFDLDTALDAVEKLYQDCIRASQDHRRNKGMAQK